MLKAGLPVYEASIGLNEYRAFLRSGDAAYATLAAGGGVLGMPEVVAFWNMEKAPAT